MRQLKFRAWDNISKSFVKNEFLLTSSKDGIMEIAGVSNDKESECLNDDVIISQFTGLHDKNVTEIYEDDIIKDLITSVVYRIRFGFCKIHGFNGWYCESLNIDGRITTLNGDYDSNENENIEVIGNIYEHPHLIEKEAVR